MRHITIIALSALATFFILKTILLSNELKATKASVAVMEQDFNSKLNEIEMKSTTLSEWEMFTLALMKVESDYNPSAVSVVGARGYFQITPIYVAEVNRVHKTNYTFEEVVSSFEKSYEVFILMQEAHNKDYSLDKALRLHNGNHKWYHRRVYKEMENIKRYEKMRRKVKDANNPNPNI